MLSAFAARRAAQVQTSSNTEKTSKNEASKEAEAVDEDEKQLKMILSPPSKRKSAVRSERGRSRKRPKGKDRSNTESLQNHRYFHPTHDVIDSMSQSEDGDSMSSSEDETDPELDPRDNSNIELPPAKTRRGWSPSQPVRDSSESSPEDEAMDDPLTGNSARANASRNKDRQGPLSSFVLKFGSNAFKSFEDKTLSGTIVSLKLGETLALLGTYSLTILTGRVSIQGTTLSANKHVAHSIFAARCSPIPIITPEIANSSDHDNLRELPSHIKNAIPENSTLLLLKDLHTGVQDLEKTCSIFSQNFELATRSSDALGLSTAQILSMEESGLRPWVCSPIWQSTLQTIVPIQDASEEAQIADDIPVSVFLVKGAKRTGKSTMARTILNRLFAKYRRVAFLETDLGQTEFTPPGMVSLHVLNRPMFGPSFAHHLDPYRAHYVGSTSPRHCPSHYLASIKNLVEVYRMEVQYSELDDFSGPSHDNRIDGYVPLVVNTMGWTKGLGADLVQQIEEILEPSHIISIQSSIADEDEQVLVNVHASSTGRAPEVSGGPYVFNVNAIPSEAQNLRYTAADWRTLSLMSYFYMQRSDEEGAREYPCWEISAPLTSLRPYAVSARKALDFIFLVSPNSDDVVPAELPTVLNGALVALVSCESNASLDSSSIETKDHIFHYTQGAQPPDPATSRCIGLAVIRGSALKSQIQNNMEIDIDDEDYIFHVLTPIPLSSIKSSNCRCFVKGELELPVWGMIDVGELERGRKEETDLPYLQWGSHSGAIGSERRRVRRNLMRRSQM